MRRATYHLPVAYLAGQAEPPVFLQWLLFLFVQLRRAFEACLPGQQRGEHMKAARIDPKS